MAKTIDQIQALIDSQSLDARQLLNLIADYLKANPGGGGASGIDDVLAIGQALSGDRTVDLDGNSLSINESGFGYIVLDPTPGSEQAGIKAQNHSNPDTYGYSNVSTTDADVNLNWYGSFNDGETEFYIHGQAQASGSNLEYEADTHTFNGAIINPDLVAADFADDTAAGVGGIAVGGFYHTAGVVKVRLI